MPRQEPCDGGILTGPVSRECDHACLGESLERCVRVNGETFVHLADQAPICGEFDKDRCACRAQLRQSRFAETLMAGSRLVGSGWRGMGCIREADRQDRDRCECGRK